MEEQFVSPTAHLIIELLKEDVRTAQLVVGERIRTAERISEAINVPVKAIRLTYAELRTLGILPSKGFRLVGLPARTRPMPESSVLPQSTPDQASPVAVREDSAAPRTPAVVELVAAETTLRAPSPVRVPSPGAVYITWRRWSALYDKDEFAVLLVDMGLWRVSDLTSGTFRPDPEAVKPHVGVGGREGWVGHLAVQLAPKWRRTFGPSGTDAQVISDHVDRLRPHLDIEGRTSVSQADLTVIADLPWSWTLVHPRELVKPYVTLTDRRNEVISLLGSRGMSPEQMTFQDAAWPGPEQSTVTLPLEVLWEFATRTRAHAEIKPGRRRRSA